MCECILTKWALAIAMLVSLALSVLLAGELPKSDDNSFEVEPPLLIPPLGADDESGEDARAAPANVAQLEEQLERAKKSATAAKRLVKSGVLAKTEAEQRALRVSRLESELANARLRAAQEEVTALKARLAAGQASQTEVDGGSAALTQATVAAQSAKENYHQAQLDAAALNLRRQRQLLSLGSARKSDVTRAEEKLARLQRDEETPR